MALHHCYLRIRVQIRSSTTARARPINEGRCNSRRSAAPHSLFNQSPLVFNVARRTWQGPRIFWLITLRFHFVSCARSSITTAAAQEPPNGAPALHSQTSESPRILPIHSYPVLFALQLPGLATSALVTNTLGYISALRSTTSPCN